MGRLRWFADGHGLASPGRWPPDRRPSGTNDRDLLLHKELMDGLLRLLSEFLDVKREVCRLATGHAKASPFRGWVKGNFGPGPRATAFLLGGHQ